MYRFRNLNNIGMRKWIHPFVSLVFQIKCSQALSTVLRSTSPLESINVFDKRIYLKRDDKLDNNSLSGNKARKFYKLSVSEEFPKQILSYGGCQSNAMLALSKLVCKKSSSRFTYFTKQIPKYMKSSPVGNLALAVENGMELVELKKEEYNRMVESNFPVLTNNFSVKIEDDFLWIPQGGSDAGAEVGVNLLAEEIIQDIKFTNIKSKWKVVAASGTGTTALFLSRAIHSYNQNNMSQSKSRVNSESNFIKSHHDEPIDVEVVTASCCGSEEYLLQQMLKLDAKTGSYGVFPKILPLSKPHPFAEPSKNHLNVWRQLYNQSGVEFDLIYAPRTWEILLDSWNNDPDFWKNSNILYIHCGGVEGNVSQWKRYERLGYL